MSDLQRLAMLVQAEHYGTIKPEQRAVLNELRERAKRKNQNLAQYVEPILTVGSSAISEPVSGFVGLAGLPYGGDVAAGAVQRTQDALTYKPKSQAGQKGLEKLGGFAQGVADKVNPVVSGTVASLVDAVPFLNANAQDVYNQLPKQGLGYDLGDMTLRATNSPAAATAASIAPSVAMELLGLKGLGAAADAGKLGKQFEFGDIGGQSFRQRGAVGGLVRDWDAELAPDENWYFHTSPDEIGEIGTKGKFGENLFFADEPYSMTQSKDAKLYRMKLKDSEIIDADQIPYVVDDSNMDAYNKKVNDLVSDLEWAFDEQGIDVDDRFDIAENLISESDNAFDIFDDIDPSDISDISWDVQRYTGDMAKVLGYKAARGMDEQGSVLIAPMMGRRSEMILDQ